MFSSALERAVVQPGLKWPPPGCILLLPSELQCVLFHLAWVSVESGPMAKETFFRKNSDLCQWRTQYGETKMHKVGRNTFLNAFRGCLVGVGQWKVV